MHVFSQQILDRIHYFDLPEPGKIVLIGDRPGPGTPLHEKRIPFGTDKYCSGWLNKQLTIPEAELRWLNSANFEGVETPFEELQKLLPARSVIALGNNASKWLRKHKVEHHLVPHPQFWKRFKHHEPYPLIKLLNIYVANGE